MSLALLYHAVLELPPQDDPAGYTLVVSPDELDWQLADLRERGVRSLTLDEFHAGDDGALLTFDDAYAHLLPTVTPLLERHGFTAAMFVPWESIGGANDWDEPPLPVAGLPIASSADLKQAAEGAWELASHGLRHIDLRSLPLDTATEELATARAQLSELAGREVQDLAYPYGRHDETTKAAARTAGYRAAFTVDETVPGDPFGIPRRTIRGGKSRAAFRIKVDEDLGRIFG